MLILLTDGVSNAGVLEPLRARKSRAPKACIHTVAFGGDGSMRLFGIPISTDQDPVDEATLKKIASMTGGQFFRARDTAQLAGIYAELDRLEPVAAKGPSLRPREERMPGRWGWRCCWACWPGCGRSVADDRVCFESPRLERIALPATRVVVGAAGVALILALAVYRQRRSDAWRQAVDAHLLPHLLAAGAKRRVRLPWALLLAGHWHRWPWPGRVAPAGTTDVPGQRTAAGGAGPVQPDHGNRSSAVAPAAGAGESGRAAARAPGRAGAGGVCR